ncbi:MAG: TonB-dependent receptor [Rhodospirillales bacterium]
MSHAAPRAAPAAPGAIGGVVDLHTIGIDDVLKPGQTMGLLTTDMYGTNHYDGSGMVAAGWRFSPALDGVAAFSLRNSGDYEDGNGDTVPASYQRLKSGLIKLDAVPGADQVLRLGAIFYHNNFGSDADGVETHDDIDSKTVNAEYRYTPAALQLVDLHANFYYVDTNLIDQVPSFQAVTLAPADTTHVGLTTLGGSADNTARFDVGPLPATVLFGGEYVHDAVSTTDQTGDAGETPSGTRSLGSLYTQGQLTWNIFQLTGNLRYDHYELNGSGTNLTPGVTGVAVGPFNVNRSADGFSPKVTLAAALMHGLSIYGNYGLGFRPPAITETLFSGAHPGLDFLRFVPNPNLSPERTQGWEAGLKLDRHGVLVPADRVTLAADYFYTRISGYITQTLVVGPPDPASPIPIPVEAFFYQNAPGHTVTRGAELQAAYKSRLVFANIAYTNVQTALPRPDYTGFNAVLTAPPRSVFDATLGLTLLDQRLTLGARMRAATATVGQASAETGVPISVPGYAVFDLFGSFALRPELRFFASIDNVTNRQYFLDALATDPTPGLTAKLGITLALGR